MTRTEIVFQLTRRELEALAELESPGAPRPFDYRTLRALVNKGMVEGGQQPTLTHAGNLFLSFTRACSLFANQAGRAEP